MVGWSLLALFLISVLLDSVKPQCQVCGMLGSCREFDGTPIVENSVIIRCSPDDVGNSNAISSFDDDVGSLGNATSNDTDSLAEISPNITLPLLGPDRLLNFSRRAFTNVRYLNFSRNAVDSFKGYFDSLIKLDLSHNEIRSISGSQFQSPQLAHLIISNNNLISLCNFSHNTLQYLDASCNNITELCLGELPKLSTLHLGRNHISEIAAKTLFRQIPKLETLNLSSNAITKINDYNFNLSSLLRLYLGNNKISYLSEKCFYGLGKLQFLDISDNRITNVFPSMFQYLPLVQLIVSDNPELMTQDFGILLASERLKIVNASRTNQNKIPACLTRSVRYLSLSYNKIAQIQCGDLDSYPLLNSLDLSYNNISFIEDDALGRLELLETILLGHNRLTFIPYTLPSNLKFLHLNHNYLTKINPSDFTGLVKLKHLDLAESYIVSIADGSFSQMYGLVNLNLSMNPLEVVSTGTLAGPHKLKILDLSELVNITKCNQDLCFPVPEPNELTELYIEGSSELGHRLMSDAAALKTFKQLNVLNLKNCNLSEIPGDMPNYFPRLRDLHLGNNHLNCSKIQEMYVWSDITEASECTFRFNEKVTTTVASSTTGSTAYPVSTENIESSHTPGVSDLSLDTYIKNNSIRYSEEAEVISNEIWLTEDQLGLVDAYSAEAPSSHPGLFIMLLIPVALAGVVLILNYSRLKRKVRIEQRRVMDIEISNISSELW